MSPFRGALAQSVEQLAFNQLVVRSSRTRPTIILHGKSSLFLSCQPEGRSVLAADPTIILHGKSSLFLHANLKAGAFLPQTPPLFCTARAVCSYHASLEAGVFSPQPPHVLSHISLSSRATPKPPKNGKMVYSL